MAWVSINTARNAQDAPISQDWGNDVVNDLNYLFGLSSNITDADGAPIVQNGSFELDANNSTTVTGWTVSLGTGATGIVTNSDQNHGAQSFKFTRDSTVGHSGGSLTSSFMNCSPSLAYQIQFMLKCSRSDVENTVQVQWFTASQSLISTTTIYDSGLGSNAPTTWVSLCSAIITPPATAMFCKIVLNAGISAQTPGATTSILFDGVFMMLRIPLSSGISYTSSTSLTIPPGVYLIYVKIFARGAYCEGPILVNPGQVAIITVSAVPLQTNSLSVNGIIFTATNSSAPNGGGIGTASGGMINLTGGSPLNISAPFISVQY